MNKIIIDCDMLPDGTPIAYHTFDADRPADGSILSPTDNKTAISAHDWLTYMSQNKALMKQAGWLETSKLPGLPAGTTRWQVLINTVQQPTADVALKQLGLS